MQLEANSYFFRNVTLTDAVLRVRSLGTVMPFYHDVLGFRLITFDSSRAELSADGRSPALIVLEEHPEAEQRVAGTPGLFHLAFLYPHRKALASASRRLTDSGHSILGASDHGVSEAVYTADPEGNGIELYADRPAWNWPRLGESVDMVTRPLGMEAMLAGGGPPVGQYGVPVDTRLGHVHLQVADQNRAERVLTAVLGMKVRQRNYPGAIFFAYDDYHHHFATNTWGIRGGSAANTLGLAMVSLRLSSSVALDPSVKTVDLDGVGLRVIRSQS